MLVGVPLTAQVTICPAGTASPATQGDPPLRVQAPTVTPVGNPLSVQVVAVAAAAVPILLQVKLPV